MTLVPGPGFNLYLLDIPPICPVQDLSTGMFKMGLTNDVYLKPFKAISIINGENSDYSMMVNIFC